MPYVITTRPWQDPRGAMPWNPIARRTVATLDDLRRVLDNIVTTAPGYTEVAGLPTDAWIASRIDEDRGGTIGPLPDGTVIEVERVR